MRPGTKDARTQGPLIHRMEKGTYAASKQVFLRGAMKRAMILAMRLEMFGKRAAYHLAVASYRDTFNILPLNLIWEV